MSSRILWLASFSEIAGEVHEGSAWSEAWNPSELAQNLASQSDTVRAKLEEGDGCAALTEAVALREQAQNAIDEGRVPSRLQPELRRRANRLVDSIVCVRPEPPPPPPPPPSDEEEEDD
jgi:hypothetical protein